MRLSTPKERHKAAHLSYAAKKRIKEAAKKWASQTGFKLSKGFHAPQPHPEGDEL